MSETPEAVKDFTFDDPSDPKEHRVYVLNQYSKLSSPRFPLLTFALPRSYEALVKDRLIDLFRRHGAIDWEPPLLLPVTDLLVDFKKEPGARFLNRTGQLVELPYDGLVSFARHIARTKRERLKRYHFGASFRESMGGQPVSFGEVSSSSRRGFSPNLHSTRPAPDGVPLLTQVAYDILSPVRSMASEAEIMSVLDKIIDAFPGLTRRHEWEFHITHQAGQPCPLLSSALEVTALAD
jgi:translation initiation factor 2-alpha kinase 4